MKNAGIPVVPGADSGITTPEEAIPLAKAIGFPLIVKASSGGEEEE